MTSSDCQKLASRLLDPDPEVAEHLLGCVDCRRRAAFARSLAEKVRQAESEPSLPEGLTSRLVARLDRLPSPRRKSHSASLVGILALAAALAIAFFLWGRPQVDPLVADMVRHHEGCFHIQNTRAKAEQFRRWMVAHSDRELPIPARWPATLTPVDRRDCPVAEGARGPHLMYAGSSQGQVSLYVLPRADLQGIASLSQKPTAHRYNGYSVLVWEREGWLYGLVARVNEAELRGWVALRGELQVELAARALFRPIPGRFTVDGQVRNHTRALRPGSVGPRRGALPLRPAAL
ncbi:hypothetical protein DYH09_26980 [bacterium CPR1]|nr:hypothetical protein [bacterium CPR1]